jgi:PAS domain S-box-containing protein
MKIKPKKTGTTGNKTVNHGKSMARRLPSGQKPQKLKARLGSTQKNIPGRKPSDEALLLSEARYRNLNETQTEVIACSDLSGNLTHVNDAYCRIFGKTREELIGHSYTATLFPPDLAVVLSAIEALNLPPHRNQIQTRHITPEDIRWFSWENSAILDEHGRIRELQGVGRDITDRILTEEKLRESEEKYRTLVEAADDTILLADLNGKHLFRNNAFYTNLGYEPGEKVDLDGFSMIHPDDAPRIRSGMDQLLEHGTVTAEFRSRHKNGRWLNRFAKFTLIRDDEQKPEAVLSIIRNITERKLGEEKLRESEERFRKLIEQAPVAITISRAGVSLYANPKFLETFQFKNLEEIVGRPSYTLFAPAYQAESKERTRRRAQGLPVPTEFDSFALKTDGSQFPVHFAVAQVELLEGPANVAFVTDTTERRQADDKIRRQLKRLTALSEIDQVIASSFDLSISLDRIVDHVISELGVDAADVLLFDPIMNILEYGAGHGFYTKHIEMGQVRLGEGLAGRAVLERRTIQVADLKDGTDHPVFNSFLAYEGFVCYYGLPLIAKGHIKGVLEIFHRSALNTDSEWLNFLETLAGQAAIAVDNLELFDRLQRSNDELILAYDATIEGWSRAMDLRDKETEGHTQRVTRMTHQLAGKFGLLDEQLVHIHRGALLHDIGKMGVPDAILLKSGALDEEEFAIMRQHPTFAHEMLSPINFLRPALDIPLCHHEKWDGTGYPRGLKGEQIPLSARMFAVVDVWDALTSDRPYRSAWSKEKALEYIQSQAGTQFDPQVVQVFLETEFIKTL